MSATTNSKMMAYDTAKKSFDYVKCENGILAVSGGGGGGGDASASNQELQIQQAQTTNNKLTTVVTDLGIVKADLHASYIIQEAINDKIDVRVIKCDTDNIAGEVTIDSTTPVQTLGLAKVYGTLNNTFLTTDADQNLRVFVENQSSTTGLALESTLLNIKTQADKLKFTGDKLQVETITGFATSAKQDTQIQAQADTILAVDGVANKLTPLPVQQAKYTIEAVPSLAPGLNPTFTTPPSGIPKDEGWYFKNTATGQPSQVYFYSYTNPALAVPARQKAYQIDDITNSYAIVRILAMNSGTGLPFMGIYSRPTGSGDHVPGFYKSRKTYSIPNGALLTQGMKYLIWWGSVAPSVKLHPELARIQLELSSSVGPGLSTELLAFLTINTDSTALAGNAEYILGGAGFSFADSAIMDSLFTGESSSSSASGDASSANQTLQLNQATESNVAICGKLDLLQSSNVIAKAQFTADEINTSNLCLQVRDELVQRNISSLASTIGQGVYVNMQTEIPVSGGQKLFGDNTGNLFVRDLSAISSIDALKDEVFATNGVLSDVVAGTQQFHVAIDALNNDSVAIYGYSPVLSMPEAIYTVDNAMKIYVDNVPAVNLQADYAGNKVSLLTDASQRLLVSSQIEGDVNIGNQITGFATESTLDAIKSKTDQLAFGDASALLVQGEFFQGNQPVSFETPQDVNLYASDFKLTSTQTGESQFSLDVNVNNLQAIPVTVQQMVYTGESELMVYDGDVFTELQTLNTKVIVCDTNAVEIPNGVDIMNFPTSFQIENKTGTSIAITTSAPLDTNIYAVHNGTPVQVVAASSGHLLVNSTLETDANGALTSENVTGTETYNALHSWIKNPALTVNVRGYASTESAFVPISVDENGTVSTAIAGAVSVQNAVGQTMAVSGSVTSQLSTVDNGSLTSTLSGTGNSIHALDVQIQNTSITAIQKSQPASVQQVITNEVINCTGPADSRGLTAQIDTTGYLYVSFILNITNYSESGFATVNLYAQSSPDGVMWFNESSNGVYANGQVKIQIYSVLTVPYVRLYLDCAGVSPPNIKQFTIEKCFLCMK